MARFNKAEPIRNEGLLAWSPLPRAEHRRGRRKKRADCLSASEFPRVPSAVVTHREKRGTGVFFWFVFFHVKENEQEQINCF